MKNVIFYTDNPKLEQTVVTICQKQGLSIKTVFDFDMAVNYISSRDYDLLLINDSIPFQEQNKLANKLWDKKANAPFLLLVDDKENKQFSKNRLLGAEIIGPLDVWNKLEEFLEAFTRNSSNSLRENILYVEDLDSPREIISMFLQKLSQANVDECASGKEALEKLKDPSKEYTCVVTDIKMPQMNGCELIKHIRGDSRLKNLPIIVLTAYGTVDWLIDCLKAGASGFLVKPPKAKDLNSELSRVRRINQYNLNPHLTTVEEAENLREYLEGKM